MSEPALSDQPLVSICLASYNHGPFLAAALDSALAQTYEHREIIVADDSSADDSLAIAERYAAQHPEVIKVITHRGRANRGISATINAAVLSAKGEFICPFSSDDLLYPDKLATQVAVLGRDTGLGFVYGQVEYVDEAGRRLGRVGGADISRDPQPVHTLIAANPIPSVTLMVRRECLVRVGLWDESLVYSDWDLCVRLLAHYRVGFVPRPLVMYRVHDSNTSVNIDPLVDLEYRRVALIALDRKASSVGGALASPRTQALIHLQLGYSWFRLGDARQAARAMTSAFERDPTLASNPAYLGLWLSRRPRDFARWAVREIREQLGRSLGMSASAAMRGVIVGRHVRDGPGIMLRWLCKTRWGS